jgi:hypothetical protein
MSKYALCWEGQVLVYRFKNLRDGIYAFYCGDVYMGQLFKMRRRKGYTWTAVPNWPSPYSPYDGLSSRLDACEMCIKIFRHAMKDLIRKEAMLHQLKQKEDK